MVTQFILEGISFFFYYWKPEALSIVYILIRLEKIFKHFMQILTIFDNLNTDVF